MQASCGGPKEACDNMMAEFEALNEAMRKDIESSKR